MIGIDGEIVEAVRTGVDGLANDYELLGLGVVRQAQQDIAHDGEHDDVCADAEREGKKGGRAEGRASPQLSKCEPQFAEKSMHGRDCLLLRPSHRCGAETEGDKLSRDRFLLRNAVVDARFLPKDSGAAKCGLSRISGCLVNDERRWAVHERATVAESGQSEGTVLLCRAGLQPAERVACPDAHGGCSGDERPVEERLDRVAQRRIATRENAEAFDSRGTDHVASVFAELPEDFSSEANVCRCAGGARDDEAKMPAGA